MALPRAAARRAPPRRALAFSRPRSKRPSGDSERLSIEDLAGDLRRICDELRGRAARHRCAFDGCAGRPRVLPAEPDDVAALVLMCGTFGRITTTFHGTDLLDQVLPGLSEGARVFPGMARAVWGRVPAALAFRVACAGRELDGERIREEDFQRYWEHRLLMDPDVFLRMLQLAGGTMRGASLPRSMSRPSSSRPSTTPSRRWRSPKRWRGHAERGARGDRRGQPRRACRAASAHRRAPRRVLESSRLGRQSGRTSTPRETAAGPSRRTCPRGTNDSFDTRTKVPFELPTSVRNTCPTSEWTRQCSPET